MKKLFLLSMITAILLLSACQTNQSNSVEMTKTALLDKIRGGWVGKSYGVAFGGPTEFSHQGKIIEGALELDPEGLRGLSGQDDMYVNMVAPGEPGVFVGFWQMFDEAEVAFGQTIWVAIEVPGATPTPTTEATATPTLPLPTDTEPAPTDTIPAPTETPQPTPTEIGGDLVGVEWLMERYINPEDPDTEIEPIEGTELTAFFNSDGALTGSAGCNPLFCPLVSEDPPLRLIPQKTPLITK